MDVDESRKAIAHRDFALVILGAILVVWPGRSLAFPLAILTKGEIDLNGWDLKADSFNSGDPTKSNGGLYDSLKAGDQGDVAALGGMTNRFPVGGALVYGHLYTASNSDVMLGQNGGVGTHAWLATNTGIEPGFELVENFPFPDTTPPYSTGLLPGPGDIVTSPGVTNHYDHVLYSADYSAPDLSGTTVVLGKARLATPNGLRLIGGDQVTIAPGASLALYSGGSTCVVGGNGIWNQSGFAAAFVLYCSSTVSNLDLNANAPFIGILVAPAAVASLNGAGTSVVHFSGALIAQSLILNGEFQFHFDESLRTAITLTTASVSNQFQLNISGIPGFRYVVQGSTNLVVWDSFTTNTSPFAFADPIGATLSHRYYRVRYSP